MKYTETRWYNCKRMWRNCGRGEIFTATNTTSNRLESSWNQFKQHLRRKLHIDTCVAVVIAHLTAVLCREE